MTLNIDCDESDDIVIINRVDSTRNLFIVVVVCE